MKPTSLFRAELPLLIGVATTVLFLLIGKPWLTEYTGAVSFTFQFLLLFSVMLWLSFSVVRHADALAVLLGEPYGTMILTLAVISIEVVMISAVMITGENPTLGRDTMFAVLMIVLNGMVGMTMLLGGWRHHAPSFNLQGANAYLGVIVPLASLTLILPSFTTSAPGGEPSAALSVFLIITSAVLYGVFLGIQTTRHRQYFIQPGSEDEPDHDGHDGHNDHDDHAGLVVKTVGYHATLLLLTMIPIVLLSKPMAGLVDRGITQIGAPQALGGFLVAILVLAPEGLAAVRAALNNRMQRAINIGLGSGVATIGLTVPAVLMIGFFTGERVELGLAPVESLILVVTLATMIVNASSGRTNVLQGVVHLLLFAAYVVLLFD